MARKRGRRRGKRQRGGGKRQRGLNTRSNKRNRLLSAMYPYGTGGI